MARTRSQCAVKTPLQPDGGASISKTQRRCARTREVAMAAGAQGQQKKMKKQHRRPLLFRISAGNKMVIPFAPFAYLVREITEFRSRKVTRWTPEAILLLQDVAEFYLEVMFENRLTFTTDVELGRAIITAVLEELEGSQYMGEHIVTEPAATATARQQRKQEEPSQRASAPAKRTRRRKAPAEGAGIRELCDKRARWPSSRYPASDWVGGNS